MEPQEIHTTTSSRSTTAQHGRARCQSRNRSGSQCRLHVQFPSAIFCSRHAAKNVPILDDSLDLHDDIFADEESVFSDAENINKALTNVVTLLAEGRISTRRAAAISYALSLILRTVVLMDQQAANEPPQFLWGHPRPNPNATPAPDPPQPAPHV